MALCGGLKLFVATVEDFPMSFVMEEVGFVVVGVEDFPMSFVMEEVGFVVLGLKYSESRVI